MNAQTIFSCPVCHDTEYTVITQYSAITESFKNREIVKCKSCSTISMHPCELDLVPEEYYEKQYWTDEIFARRSSALRAQAESRCVFMQPGISRNKNLRVLDVGAGVGYMNWGFRAVWPDRQTEYNAIEVNSAAIKFLMSDQGVDNVYNHLYEVQGVFDVIVLSHILEHITKPAAFLSQIKVLLVEQDGCLFVEVPALDFRFKKRNEPHVLFYSTESLSEVLDRNGFDVLKISTCGHPVWKKRADGGMDTPNPMLSFRQFMYQLFVRKNTEFTKYGGDRQWIRAICKHKTA